MHKLSRLGVLVLPGLVLAVLLVACGDATTTAIPAKITNTAIVQPTEGATAKPTDAAVLAGKTTEAAMVMQTTVTAAKTTTEAAMVAKTTTEAAMVAKTTDTVTVAKIARPLSGTFNNQGVDAVAGKAIIGKMADGKIVLSFENFKSANGPDLYVYLTKENNPASAASIKQGLEIGKLKATQGNLNYELNSSLDLDQYKAVAVYCKSFSVIFGFANFKAEVA